MSEIILTDKKQEPSLVRNEHIVPRSHLNRFADNKQIWVYKQGIKPRNKSTKSQATENNYFEYAVANWSSKNLYENWFKRIEDSATAVLPFILDGNKYLTQEQIMSWATYVAMLFLRTRKVRGQIVPKISAALKEKFLPTERVREIQHLLFLQGELIPFDNLRLASQRTWTEINANPAFTHMLGLRKILAVLTIEVIERNWHTLEAAPNSFFVTSDCPVITMKKVEDNVGPTSYSFAEPDVAIALALSPQKVFVASPSAVTWPQLLEEQYVHAFNTLVVQFADRAVYSARHSRGLEQLVEREINKAVFEKNAFSPAFHSASNPDSWSPV